MAAPTKKPIGVGSLSTPLQPSAMLKAMRDLLGLSQENFAQRVGLKRQQISAYERGSTAPNITTLAEIADKAGVDIEVVIKLRHGVPARPAGERDGG